jgi:hypothetical protein
MMQQGLYVTIPFKDEALGLIFVEVQLILQRSGISRSNGGEHPAIRPYPGRYVALAGFHMARLPFAVHVTEYRYFGRSGIAGSSDWINLSFEYRC